MRPKVAIITKVVVASLLIIAIIRPTLGCDPLGAASESRHNYEGRGSIPVPESYRSTLGATPLPSCADFRTRPLRGRLRESAYSVQGQGWRPPFICRHAGLLEGVPTASETLSEGPPTRSENLQNACRMTSKLPQTVSEVRMNCILARPRITRGQLLRPPYIARDSSCSQHISQWASCCDLQLGPPPAAATT